MASINRYYDNHGGSCGKQPFWDSQNKTLLESVRIEIAKTRERLLNILEENSKKILNLKDVSVYTGSSGLALLYYFLSSKEGSQPYLEKAYYMANESRKVKSRKHTFLCGDLGPLCLTAVTCLKLGKQRQFEECKNEILDWMPQILEDDPELPSELLYGRAGYLFGLLYLNKNAPLTVDSADLKKVASAIISCGESEGNSHLMWSWHGKQYLGAAHGLTGIVYVLLLIQDLLSERQLRKLKSTVDYLLDLRFSSGNLRSSIGSESDRLVHWCHGAPGAVHLFLIAFEVWREEKYLTAAEACGDVVWERGLLRKGYGLCHGVAGNGYTFLALFQVTNREIHLFRALEFARWCKSYNEHQERTPDRPYSLFEGLAGTVYFLRDIQDPLEACFPAFSLQPFTEITNS